ncbi:MAG: haloacid dehalogenase [Thermoproteota archaeon]
MSVRIPNIDVERLAGRFREVVSEIDAVLSKREEVRDKLIKMGRDIVRLSGQVINAIHRGALDEARRLLEQMSAAAQEYMELARAEPFMWYSGHTANVLSEYVEAVAFYRLVTEGSLPSLEELGTPEVPYLQGIGDMFGEARRLVLDLLRQGRIDEAERLLEAVEALYFELRALEYPEALLPGVRHKVDVARRLIDDTKSLLLTVKSRAGCCRASEG